METQKKYTYWLKAIEGSDEVQARRYAAAMALEIGWGAYQKFINSPGCHIQQLKRGYKNCKA